MVTMALRVVFAGKQHGAFEPLEQLRVRLHLAPDVGQHVFAFARQLEQRVEILGHRADALGVADGLFQPLAILHHLLALLGLVPEVRLRDLCFGLS
jgi:hypothetical protein